MDDKYSGWEGMNRVLLGQDRDCDGLFQNIVINIWVSKNARSLFSSY
jgi:hypothetical protein